MGPWITMLFVSAVLSPIETAASQEYELLGLRSRSALSHDAIIIEDLGQPPTGHDYDNLLTWRGFNWAKYCTHTDLRQTDLRVVQRGQWDRILMGPWITMLFVSVLPLAISMTAVWF